MAERNPAVTRRTLLETAFGAFYENGFQATGLDQVLASAGVTKGALYHHFKNKMELGYAVVDEVLRPLMHKQWVAPLTDSDDPLTTIMELQRSVMEEMDDYMFHAGCPVNNLTQEMAAADEGFRLRLDALLEDWRTALARALERGRGAGTVRADVDPEATAAFLVASWEGMAGTGKASRSRELMMAMTGVMGTFLETLRPTTAAAVV